MTNITLNDLLNAYANGIFPMSEDRHDPSLFWVNPEIRGILPLDRFHIPRRLKRTVKADKFRVRVDSDFRACILECSRPRPGRRSTWINDHIIDLYTRLAERGFAHSVECWKDGTMCGGLYGVSIGGAFFGESMFSAETDASKVALVHLVARLKAGGYRLLDTQFITDHLKQFGAIEIPRKRYLEILSEAILINANFYSLDGSFSGAEILQSITQTS